MLQMFAQMHNALYLPLFVSLFCTLRLFIKVNKVLQE